MGLVDIFNAKNLLLNHNSGTLPEVADTIMDWFQPMTFEIVTKAVVGFQLKETPTSISFQGVWQPYQPRELDMQAHGQRKWGWYRLHALPGIDLLTDDVVIYLGIQYRVLSKLTYKLYGYDEYKLLVDYTGSGP